MIITAIKANKFNQKASVFLDGGFAFSIHPQIILAKSLKLNQNLSSSEIKTIIFESLLLELYTASINLISIRSRSTQELSLYLIKAVSKLTIKTENKIIEEIYQEIVGNKITLINRTINKLAHNHYLDDYKFARQYALDKVNFHHKGKKYIQNQLTQKGIEPSIISIVLSDSSVFKKFQEQNNIQVLIAKNYQNIAYKQYPKIKLKNLLIQRLLRQGYSFDQVIKQIDEFLISK